MRKLVFGVSDQAYTDLAVYSQNMARGSKFCNYEVERSYYLYSEKKVLISCAYTAQLFCGFVFAYAKRRFSHDTAHLV